MGRKSVDITGQKFGRLTAIKCVGHSKSGKTQKWLCECECGNTVVVYKNALTNGNTKSCGCLLKETMKEIGKQNHDNGEKVGHIYGKLSGERIRKQQLNGVLSKANKTGYSGVFKNKKGFYQASLTYKYKRYATSFMNIEDAINWRKNLEQELGIYTEEGIKA